jgi:hypothetical protein
MTKNQKAYNFLPLALFGCERRTMVAGVTGEVLYDARRRPL